MNLTLYRAPSSDHGTFGALYHNGMRLCYVGEPPWRNNKATYSCLPEGSYGAVWHKSPKYGWCYLVTGTSPRSFILTHGGNFAGDRKKGMISHTYGCLLLGSAYGFMVPKGKRMKQAAVLASRTAVRQFFSYMQQRPFRLEVRYNA